MPQPPRAAPADSPAFPATPTAIAVGVVALGALGSCAPGGVRHLAALADALMRMWPAALWIAAAAGLGHACISGLKLGALRHWSAAIASGACVMACVDAAAGTAGLLSGSAARAWGIALLVPGIAALGMWIASGVRARLSPGTATLTGEGAHPAWERIGWALALPPLVIAAASEPGALWATEFGGFDALSYHLELPREWHAAKGIATLPHCAYSGLPSWMEAAYLHLLAVGGDGSWGGSSWMVCAQGLHAALALVAAACGAHAARLAASGCGTPRIAGAAAGLAIVGLPWLIVTGSLAYTECLALCASAAGLCILADALQRGSISRSGLAALAACAGAAVGAKASAALVVSVPMAVAAAPLWWRRPPRARLADAALAAAVPAVMLSPWLLRNVAATGNPVFPLLTGTLGAGWWSAEQGARWDAAHGAVGIAGAARDAFPAIWSQWIAFGLGAPPRAGDAWQPLWSAAPILIICCAATAALRCRTMPQWRAPGWIAAAMIALPVILWALLTHAQSRFLLPVIVPGAVIIGVAASLMPARGWGTALGAAALVWSVQPAITLLGNAPTPGLAALWIGGAQDLDGTAAGAGPPADLVQAINALAGRGSSPLAIRSPRVASIGFCTPVRVQPGIVVDWSTVWDRSAATAALAASGGDAAAMADALRAAGFTHLAVDRVMIRTWADSGWLDPAIDATALDGLIRQAPRAWEGRQGALVDLRPAEGR